MARKMSDDSVARAAKRYHEAAPLAVVANEFDVHARTLAKGVPPSGCGDPAPARVVATGVTLVPWHLSAPQAGCHRITRQSPHRSAQPLGHPSSAYPLKSSAGACRSILARWISHQPAPPSASALSRPVIDPLGGGIAGWCSRSPKPHVMPAVEPWSSAGRCATPCSLAGRAPRWMARTSTSRRSVSNQRKSGAGRPSRCGRCDP